MNAATAAFCRRAPRIPWPLRVRRDRGGPPADRESFDAVRVGHLEVIGVDLDGVDFFHMDALSSPVAMKANCDRQLTLMGSSLCRLLGACIGGGYSTAESRHIYRDFVYAQRG